MTSKDSVLVGLFTASMTEKTEDCSRGMLSESKSRDIAECGINV